MNTDYKVLVIGTSAGGMGILGKLLPAIPKNCKITVLIVQHISSGAKGNIFDRYKNGCPLSVRTAQADDSITQGTVFFAPPDFHMLINKDHTISLEHSDKVNFARPSIDVLFQSVAHVYGKQAIGVILTGASTDGTLGLQAIKQTGGYTIVQEPSSAEMDEMPFNAIQCVSPHEILDEKGLKIFFANLKLISC